MTDIERREFLGAMGVVAFSFGASTSAAQVSTFSGVVEKLAILIEREYPDPTMARSLAGLIRGNLHSSGYPASDPKALAARLTTDLQAASHDKHLVVSYDPADAALRPPAEAVPSYTPQPRRAAPSPKAKAIFGPQGYGLVKAELLAGNIGLLRIDNFVPLYDLVRDRIGHAIELLSDSWGLILDLRENEGGTAETPAYLASYFFDRPPFLLTRTVWRNQPPELAVTTRDIVGQSYGEVRPLVVATSSRTFSAAEAVAYSLQSTRRAIVVGEKTHGGANPGDFFNLGQGFVAFCPQGRAIDGVTGKNWEGTGVQPDVMASAATTLSVAHRVVVEKALQQVKETDAIEMLRAALKSGPYPLAPT